MFTNREDAGRQLSSKLLAGHVSADLVVGIARGGVVISREIANRLGIPHGVLVVKKIGSPGNPELAVGATVPKGQSLDTRGKTVILTDDGIATGETMRAAVLWVKRTGAKKIIVAVPVAPPDIQIPADEYIVLETPQEFGAVGEFYKNFPQGGT